MIEPIRYPNINGETPEKQLEEIRRYLYQLVDQINYALSAMGKEK